MSEKAKRDRWLEWALPAIAARLIWLLCATWRVEVRGRDWPGEALAEGRPVLLATFHGPVFCLISQISRYHCHILISQSRDGDRIAALGKLFGFFSIRGSSSKGGARALLQMVRVLKSGGTGGFVVDGPRGPAGEVKPGLLVAAQRSGALVIPMLGDASRKWQFDNWDRTLLPKPFARVVIRFGEPVEVPADAAPEAFEALRERIEREMHAACAALAAELGG